MEFKKELNYGDEVKISVVADSFDKFGFDIFYKLEIVNNGVPMLAGKAKTGMLCYNYESKKIMLLPEKAVAVLARG